MARGRGHDCQWPGTARDRDFARGQDFLGFEADGGARWISLHGDILTVPTADEQAARADGQDRGRKVDFSQGPMGGPRKEGGEHAAMAQRKQ